MNILDHGKIELVDHMGSDRRIAQAARVIVDAPWRDLEDPKLIKYMYANGHTSPFEHVVFTFYVKAPIFVFRQWHRHRTQSYNEISARYKELPEEFYIPLVEHVGSQSEKNHQSRDMMGNDKGELIQTLMRWYCKGAFAGYKYLLQLGCPREIARSVLPFGTYSEMYTTVNLHNLMHFMNLRLDAHAQYEIRVYAEALLELIRPIVPLCVEAFENR